MSKNRTLTHDEREQLKKDYLQAYRLVKGREGCDWDIYGDKADALRADEEQAPAPARVGHLSGLGANGSALVLGARGSRFKSGSPDQTKNMPRTFGGVGRYDRTKSNPDRIRF